MTADQAATRDRIRKLLAVTEANGATPAEAAGARSLADRLMAAHGVNGEDVGAGTEWAEVPFGPAVLIDSSEFLFVASILRELRSVYVLARGRGVSSMAVAFGRRRDADLAVEEYDGIRCLYAEAWSIFERETSAFGEIRYSFFAGLTIGLLASHSREGPTLWWPRWERWKDAVKRLVRTDGDLRDEFSARYPASGEASLSSGNREVDPAAYWEGEAWGRRLKIPTCTPAEEAIECASEKS